MAYSKYYEKNPKKKPPWPDLRYNATTGEVKLFNSPEDVPQGWFPRPKGKFVQTAPKTYDKQDLINKLLAKGVTIDPRWGSAQLKKVFDDLSSPR